LLEGSGAAANPEIATPHLSMWLRGAYRPPPEVLLEIADIVIKRLLDAKPTAKGAAASDERLASEATWRNELLCVHAEAELHRLETVLTRADAIALRKQSSDVRQRARSLCRRAAACQTAEVIAEA
jgi:hypothetical protein